MEDEGPLYIMARSMVCRACCKANLSLVEGWTYVVPRRSLIPSHEIVLNHWKSMIASSWRRASSLSNTVSSKGLRGVVVVRVMNGEYHHGLSCSIEYIVSETNDSVSRLLYLWESWVLTRGRPGYLLLRTEHARWLTVRCD